MKTAIKTLAMTFTALLFAASMQVHATISDAYFDTGNSCLGAFDAGEARDAAGNASAAHALSVQHARPHAVAAQHDAANPTWCEADWAATPAIDSRDGMHGGGATGNGFARVMQASAARGGAVALAAGISVSTAPDGGNTRPAPGDAAKPAVDGFERLESERVAALWSNQPDTRRKMTTADKNTHSGSGRVLHEDYFLKNALFVEYNHTLTSAFALACPDGINDIVVANSHSFLKDKDKNNWRVRMGNIPVQPHEYAFQNHQNRVWYLHKSDFVFGWDQDTSQKPEGPDHLDWAIVRRHKPFDNDAHIKPYPMAAPSLITDGQCVTMVAWFQPYAHHTPERYIQTCQIKDTYTKAGQKMLKHNCQTKKGSSGAALLTCHSPHKVLGLHKGAYLVDRSEAISEFRLYNNFNFAIAMTGPFKRAVLEQCGSSGTTYNATAEAEAEAEAERDRQERRKREQQAAERERQAAERERQERRERERQAAERERQERRERERQAADRRARAQTEERERKARIAAVAPACVMRGGRVQVSDNPNCFRGNQMHGQWRMEFNNGSVQEGRMTNGKKQGPWTIRFANGDVHTGDFVNDVRQGTWMIRFASGTVSTGKYANGKKNGAWENVYTIGLRDVLCWRNGNQTDSAHCY